MCVGLCVIFDLHQENLKLTEVRMPVITFTAVDKMNVEGAKVHTFPGKKPTSGIISTLQGRQSGWSLFFLVRRSLGFSQSAQIPCKRMLFLSSIFWMWKLRSEKLNTLPELTQLVDGKAKV